MRRSTVAVFVLFFVNGATFSNWLPRIPEVRDHLGVSNTGLGAALIGGGLGGMAASLVVSRLLGRYGSRVSLAVAASGLAVLLPLISLAPSAAALLVVLTMLGALDVVNDLSMNAQGVAVQQRVGRSIMQRLHGGWSLGFLAGAAVGSTAGAARLDIRIHLAAVGAVLLATVLVARRHLVADAQMGGPAASPSPSPSPGRWWRSRRWSTPVAVAAMAMGLAFVEAIPNDWSAVVLDDLFAAGRLAGLGALAYAVAMLGGRLGGDHALDRLGSGRLLDGALVIAAVGVLTVASAPWAWLALAGFLVWGTGVSVLFPQLYTMAATLPGASAGRGLAAMAIGQRLGFMVEPLGVGSLADASSLRWALVGVGAAGLGVAVAGRRFLSEHASVARQRTRSPLARR